MIKKTKHPSGRGERLAIKAKKKIHSNASPVYRLLKEREEHVPADDPQPGNISE